jgi:hypothetical protein
MLEQGRLDQVFNQHVNYYSVKSLEKLLEPLGFNLINLNYNFSYWGGTQLLIFSLTEAPALDVFEQELSVENYSKSIEIFSDSMRNTSNQIENSRGPVYLFGAAQMLPPLIYHFSNEAIAKISGIIDDNPRRQNKYYPDLEIKIFSLSEISNISDSTIVISALDSSRPILNRLLELNPRTIIIPNGLI